MNDMTLQEEERIKDRVKGFYDEISDGKNDEVWRGEQPLSEVGQDITNALEPLSAANRATTLLDVLAHDDEAFGIVLARLTWELRNHYEFTCIKERGRRPAKNDIDRAMGARFDKIASKIVQEVFPEEYKQREMQKLQLELKAAKKGRRE